MPVPRFLPLLPALLISSALGCADAAGPGGSPPAIVVSPTPGSLDLGDTLQLAVLVDGDAAAAVSWSSSAPNVAYVTPSGMLRAVGPGQATLRVSAGEAWRQFMVSVTGELTIRLSPLVDRLFEGEAIVAWVQMLGATIRPDLPIQWSGTPGTLLVEPGRLCSTLCRETEYASVTAVAPGSGMVTLRYGAATVTRQVVVSPRAGGTAEAVLAAERFTVLRSGHNEYFPLLRLRETAGVSAGVVFRIDFRLEGIGVHGDVGRWDVYKPVPAGGTAEMISDDVYGDWEFWISSSLPSDTVSVTVWYRDGAGRLGSLATRTAVTVVP